MSELQDAGRMLEAAEEAAAADNLARADELLSRAARIQEAQLGPLHPDLADTLNNLAVVAEKTGRLGDAETYYRRAVAIATASLPAGHPKIAASRQNLEDFCRARGLPIDEPVLTAPAARDEAAVVGASGRFSRSLAGVVIGVVVGLVVSTFFVLRPWSSRKTSFPATPATLAIAAPTAQPTPQPQAVERPLPTSAETTMPAPTEQAPGSITLATVQLCRTLSTNAASWECDPAVEPVSPGSIVLYTRVRSPRDAVVEHRWFRGDTLRQAVKLTIRASATEGYRTYSRQIVDGGADWRVEVRTPEGALLHEQRIVVR